MSTFYKNNNLEFLLLYSSKNVRNINFRAAINIFTWRHYEERNNKYKWTFIFTINKKKTNEENESKLEIPGTK